MNCVLIYAYAYEYLVEYRVNKTLIPIRMLSVEMILKTKVNKEMEILKTLK